jgi:hypothetical protein
MRLCCNEWLTAVTRPDRQASKPRRLLIRFREPLGGHHHVVDRNDLMLGQGADLLARAARFLFIA